MKFEIRNGSITLNGNTILEEINFSINEHEHVAIVGRNGAGKSTLLRGIIEPDIIDEGIGEEKFTITRIGKFNVGYLKQIEFENVDNTLLDEVRLSFKKIIQMENKINKLEKEMTNDEKLINEYTNTLESFKLLGGYSYKSEYEVMLNKFGFTEEDKLKKIKEFSGGQRTKISFIKLLLSKPDLLLLDEPTNHLDIKTLEWLEEYLSNYKGAIVLVSHDRMFIDNIATIIYDIDYGKVIRYVGNYTKYEKLKHENYQKLVKDYELQQKEIKRLTSIYERFRNKPSKASMALSKLKAIERMDLIEMPKETDMRTFRTNLDEMEESVKKVCVLDNLEFGYDHPLGKINIEIMRGKHIAVIGENGCGKSTLLKTINGLLNPISGTISYGLKVNPGYFDQTLKMIDENNTVLKEFRDYLPKLEEGECRRALGSFLFRGEDVLKHINVLSGGEKVRLELCKILYSKPNFLILDEPTNHMDIVGKEHLEEILKNYKGTIIFVTHDRYFVKKIADELIVFTDNGVEYYKYGYDEYLEKNKHIQVLPNNKEKKIENKEVPKNNTYELKKELKSIENEIIKRETKIKSLELELYSDNVYSDYNKSICIKNKIDSINIELEDLNKRWEELTDTIMQKED